jgi:hypothetical protein
VYDSFDPDWNALNKMVNKNISAIVMIHYFGQPQNILRYQEFARNHKLLLIEDNAHGYKGVVGGCELGTFGDIGISSPRKILMTKTGGVLYINRPSVTANIQQLTLYPWWKVDNLIGRAMKKVPTLHAAVQKKIRMRQEFSNPSAFYDPPVGEWLPDPADAIKIQAVDWDALKFERAANWRSWLRLTTKYGLQPIWEKPKNGTCPWALPMYASSLEERNRWLQWGWRRNVDVFPWPSLPTPIVQKNGTSVQRWMKLICFPLDTGPQGLVIEN